MIALKIIAQIAIALISSLVGAVIGSKSAYKLKHDELKLYEKATALSIVEELKVVTKIFDDDFGPLFKDLDTENHVGTFPYTTQNFYTIFTQNAGEIGLIKKSELRNSIIKSYVDLKKFKEQVTDYNTMLDDFEKSRNAFIARAYPHLINTACATANNNEEIKTIKKYVEHSNWSWLNPQFLNQSHVITFINSDNKMLDRLHKQSLNLQNRLAEIKNIINSTIDLVEKEYSEENINERN